MLSSRGEIKIHDILTDNNVIFEEEYSFPDLISRSGNPLRFDFAVFTDDHSLDFLIEYQGRQHYEAVSVYGGTKGLYHQRYNDNLKRQYCKEHGITLVEIPYDKEYLIDYDYILEQAGY